jgi:hypothetical protein
MAEPEVEAAWRAEFKRIGETQVRDALNSITDETKRQAAFRWLGDEAEARRLREEQTHHYVRRHAPARRFRSDQSQATRMDSSGDPQAHHFCGDDRLSQFGCGVSKNASGEIAVTAIGIDALKKPHRRTRIKKSKPKKRRPVAAPKKKSGKRKARR